MAETLVKSGGFYFHFNHVHVEQYTMNNDLPGPVQNTECIGGKGTSSAELF